MRMVRPGGGDLDRGEHPQRHPVHRRHLVDDRDAARRRFTTSTASSPCIDRGDARRRPARRPGSAGARRRRSPRPPRPRRPPASPGPTVASSSRATVVPTPRPSPPGVSGLCPIIVDSVMIVSVIVSIASPLITGVASLSSTVASAAEGRPAASRARRTAVTAPAVFAGVPLTPVVLVSDGGRGRLDRRPSATSAMHASVVELPMSTPMTRDTAGLPPGGLRPREH